jgi:hypothetical protein
MLLNCQVEEKQFCVDLKRQKARIYSPWNGGRGSSPVPLVTDMEGCNATDMLALPVQLRFSVALHLQRGNLS